jgi:hypothetical protein
MTFHEVNTRIDQPMEHDIHRGIRGEYHVPWVDQSLYSQSKVVANHHRVKFCQRLIRCVLTNYFRYTIKLILADVEQTGVSGEQSRHCLVLIQI